jgi:YXWGXW repeat-containing protein
MTKSLYAIIAAILIAAVPLTASAQFSIGVGVTVGVPPPPLPYYTQPPAPYPNYMWTPGYWGYGSAGYYWVPGTWVAPPAVGLYWTPGYWGYGNGGYGWNAGYWGPTVGFYGGINYGFGFPGTGFYGGSWNGGNFAYNTAVTNVNKTVIHNTYNKTVVNKNVCNNCKNVSFNGGNGGTTARPTQAQIEARKNGKAPTTAQKQHANVAAQDRNQLASVNHGKPSLTASQKPFNDTNKPSGFAPVTASDKKAHQDSTMQNKPANNEQMHPGEQQQSQPHHKHGGGMPPESGTQGNPNGGGGKHKHNEPPDGSGQPPLR